VRAHPRAVATPVSTSKSAITKAGDWFAARQRGERLPEHMLSEDLETTLATQRMEKLP